MRSLCALLLVLASLVAGGFAASACTVTDFSTGDKYDLSPLTRTSGQNWALDTLQYTYLLNICADLLPQPIIVNGVTKNCNSTQACQIDKQNVDQSPKRLGSNPKLVVKDTGNIQLKLSGGDHCKKADVDRSVSILFNCNRKAGPGTPKFVEEDEGCLYIFEWDTVYACPSTKPTPSIETPKDCLVTDAKGQALYDLSPLTRSSGNWIVAEGNYSYLLNICAAVHGVEDCAGHSACQTKPKDPNFAKPLGLSTGRPTVENGVLKLVLTGGSLCHEQYSRKTTIIFTCKEGPSLGEPKFLEETDECMYIFSWETSAACSEDVVHTCNATDPVTSKYVDLSPLRKADSAKSNYVAASAVPGDKATYKLNLCGELASSDNPCRVGTSICQVAEGQVIGRSLGSSGVLTVDSGDVIMTYTDGDLCPGTDERASSEIYFICSETESNPRLISSSNDCQYLFNWRTRYACEGAPPTQKSGLSGGAIAIIVILSLIAAYMLGGIAYNRFVRGEKGVEQIPHYGLCQAVYYTIADRCSGLRSGTGGIQLAWVC